MDDPEFMLPIELRTIRGIVGHRLGFQGPMPQGKLAHLLKVSPRTLWSYLHGKTTIPPLVAEKARQLMADKYISWDKLPPRWKKERDSMLARRERYRRRQSERPPEDPPF